MAATTLDLPKASEWAGVQLVFAVRVTAGGDVLVDGAKVESDAQILARAKGALGESPELRAVIQADQSVPYGKVIHVLDLLKQAGIAKIAFGVVVAR